MARKGGGGGDSGGGYAERQEYMPPTDPRLGPPPDLPSLLLHNRIVYLGMALVPAVTELVRGDLSICWIVDGVIGWLSSGKWLIGRLRTNRAIDPSID